METGADEVNRDVLGLFEKALKEYYAQGRGKEDIPAVAYLAKLANLTPGYFGVLVKKMTGRTAQKMIGHHIVEIAKFHKLKYSNFAVVNETSILPRAKYIITKQSHPKF